VIDRLRRIRPLGFIVGFVAAIVLTGGGVAAYAANGGSLLIGRSNSGTAVTTLTNSAGTPLSLRAKTGYPPFAVNSSKTVANLNADWIDGINGVNLVQRTGPYSATTGNIYGDTDWAPLDPTADPPGPPDENSDMLISVATCPTGTKLTGGGVDNFTSTGFTLVDSPDANSWYVFVSVADTHGADDLPENVTAYAVCYNPRGLVSGGQPNARAAKPALTLSPAMKDKLARATARSSK
jgi:hypothetical protein